MDQKQKNVVLIVIACLLLLVAAYRFGSMAMDARSRAELTSDHSHTRPQIISHIGPQKPDPFRDLNLTTEQRRKIDDILKASMPKLPPPNQGGPGKPHNFRVMMPMDKIRTVLTPEQRKKLDQMRAPQNAIMGVPGGAPGPVGPPPGLSGSQPGSPGPRLIFMGKGPQDHSP